MVEEIIGHVLGPFGALATMAVVLYGLFLKDL